MDPRDFHASLLILKTVWCSSSSLCSPIVRLSRRGTIISQTCWRTPQHISICQFVQHVMQLNSYISQLPCWYYSPNVKMTMILMNVPFTEADLASHVLLMCPYAWQDQFNLHKKGGTPVDMHLLLLSFEAIECVGSQERSNASHNKKALYSKKKSTERPGANTTARVPKNACAEKHYNHCKKAWGRI